MAQRCFKIPYFSNFFSGWGHTPEPPFFALGFILLQKKSWLHPWILFYVHKDRADRFDILTVATKCVENSDNKKLDFGAFSPLDLETTLWQQNLKRHKQMKFYYPSWFTKCIKFWKKLYICAHFFQNIDSCPPNNFCRGTSLIYLSSWAPLSWWELV